MPEIDELESCRESLGEFVEILQQMKKLKDLLKTKEEIVLQNVPPGNYILGHVIVSVTEKSVSVLGSYTKLK